jgi:paraquat-inducible protein A
MAIACSDCGAEQTIPPLAPNTVAECVRCGRVLDRADSGLLAAFAWTSALFLLLLAANIEPVGEVFLAGKASTAHIASGVPVLVSEGWLFLALLYGLFTVLFPLVFSGMLAVVLGLLCLRVKPRGIGRMFRLCESIRLWAMPDVLVLAGLVIFSRTQIQLGSSVLIGGWCLIAAAVLMLLLPWLLASHHVWRRIMDDRSPPTDDPAISCDVCNLVMPLAAENKRCPRCRRRLWLRKPNSVNRATALVLASYILYFPSYYFPMSYSVQPNGIEYHTILSGVERLFSAGYWEGGVIIFMASIVIPLVKLIGLSWLLLSVRYPTMRGLVLRTRLHRVIHHIGRWSNTDPFVVSLMAPMITFPGLAEVHVDKAALPFALVVTLTMLASRSFDARLMWDAAEKHA